MSLTLIADSKTLVDTLIENVSNVIVGKSETVELVLVALLSNGHVLIEDVGEIDRHLDRLRLSTYAVHSRLAAERCDRCLDI